MNCCNQIVATNAGGIPYIVSTNTTVGTESINIALGVREYGHGNVFVEISLDGQVDVLVCGVGGVKIPVEITSEVEIDISVNFDIGGRGKTGSGEGNRQNEFTHTILPKKDLLIFTCKR